jgi:hypothetical protein
VGLSVFDPITPRSERFDAVLRKCSLGALVSVMNAYTRSHEFENLQDRPGLIRRFLKLLVSILSGGDSNWEAGARGL